MLLQPTFGEYVDQERLYVGYFGWNAAHCPFFKNEHGFVYSRPPCAVVCESHYTQSYRTVTSCGFLAPSYASRLSTNTLLKVTASGEDMLLVDMILVCCDTFT